MEEQLRGVDPSNPESMQQLIEGGLFDLPRSPAQAAALERLEIALALVEGWVDEVVGQATAERMPAADKLHELVRRRRAAGGPAEQTFAALVGLELRPRRLRDASTLWGSLRTRQGTEARDGVWMHPDLLPTSADLDDPLGFREDASAPDLDEVDFDAELRKLLDGDEPEDGTEQRHRRRHRTPTTVPTGSEHAPRATPRDSWPPGRRRPARRSRCVSATSPTSTRTRTGCGAAAGPTTSRRARWCSTAS